MTSKVDFGIFCTNTKRFRTQILTSLIKWLSISIDRVRSKTSTLIIRMDSEKTIMPGVKRLTTRSTHQTKSIVKCKVSKANCKITSILSEYRVMDTVIHVPK